jgi:DNA-binding NarL/FixJ family response regulator
LLTLTEREQQVVELVLKGLTNRVVAEKLSISENTVEKHMNSIMRRLDIRSRHQLLDLAGPNSEAAAN